MKINKKGYIIIVFAVILIIALATFLLKNNQVNKFEKIWYEKKYYPLVLGQDGYDDYTYTEMLAILTMPEKLLAKSSTNELALLALDYPFLVDMYSFNTIEAGFNDLSKKSNIIYELLSRDDAKDVLLKIYNNLEVDYKMLINYDKSKDTIEYIESNYIKEVFLQIYFNMNYNQLDKTQKETLKAIIEKNYKTKKDLNFNFSGNLLFFKLFVYKNESIPKEMLSDSIKNDLVSYFGKELLN